MAFVTCLPISKRPTHPSSSIRQSPRMSSSPTPISALKLAVASTALTLSLTPLLPLPTEAALFHFRGTRPDNIGVRYGRYLESCPKTNNCISSSANVYDSHYVPAWTYTSGKAPKSMQDAIADVTQVISEYPRTTIITSEPVTSEFGKGYYIYAEFESKLLGFVDDVEFFFRPDDSTVEYRSASRLGEDDLKANRTRIRDLRVALQNLDSSWASVGYN